MKKSYLFLLPIVLMLTILFCQNNTNEATKAYTNSLDSADFSVALLDAVNATSEFRQPVLS